MTSLSNLPLLDHFDSLVSWLQHYPFAYTSTLCIILMLGAWLANLMLKGILVRGISHLLHLTVFNSSSQGLPRRVISRLSNVVPAWIITTGIEFIPDLPKVVVTILSNVCNAVIVLSVALFLSGVLDLANVLYQKRPSAKYRSLKGYVQVAKIVLTLLTTILCVATLVDKSPLILLSGLGAMAAVLMLIFQGTLLAFVASVQISSGGIVKLGDWVEMQQVHANGEVIDIALHQIAVKNFDFTTSYIPTQMFISGSFVNYRGMQESNSRRVKKAFYIDQNTVHFMSETEKNKLSRFGLLKDYLKNKEAELQLWNQNLSDEGKELVNTRRITNLGSFRAYLELYLRNHPGIHQDRPLMCRHLDPGPGGLGVEIYAFTNTTVWADYENIQADIFDHILAIMPEFGLSVHQQPTGRDLTGIIAN